jgi:hypothetical protein
MNCSAEDDDEITTKTEIRTSLLDRRRTSSSGGFTYNVPFSSSLPQSPLQSARRCGKTIRRDSINASNNTQLLSPKSQGLDHQRVVIDVQFDYLF